MASTPLENGQQTASKRSARRQHDVSMTSSARSQQPANSQHMQPHMATTHSQQSVSTQHAVSTCRQHAAVPLLSALQGKGEKAYEAGLEMHRTATLKGRIY